MGLEPPTSTLRVRGANQLRHATQFIHSLINLQIDLLIQ